METLSLSPVYSHLSRWTWVSQYQNVSILDFIGAKDDGGGGDNWSYDMQSSSQIIITNKPASIKLFYSYNSLSLFTKKKSIN